MMEPRRFVVNSLGKVCATGFGISLKIEERILGRTEFWCLATLTRVSNAEPRSESLTWSPGGHIAKRSFRILKLEARDFVSVCLN